MNIIEQLKIDLQIEEARAVGNPIEWEYIFGGQCVTPTSSNVMERVANGYAVRLKPWSLGRSINWHTLPDGAEWHRQDFTQDMLPSGYRPLILGESYIAGDEYFSEIAQCWIAETYPGKNLMRNNTHGHRRTTRPIPATDKWGKEKEAFADRKVIEVRTLNSDGSWNAWRVCSDPSWHKDNEYRIKPEPVMVELGPEDVPLGSCVRLPSWEPGEWDMITKVDCSAVFIGPCSTNLNWAELKSDGWLIHRSSKPGVWEKCEKQLPQ